jgi:cysteine synthase
MTTKTEKDIVAEAIKKAIKAVNSAYGAALDDTRTNSTVCTDHLDSANYHLEQAAKWLKEFEQEQNSTEQPKFKAKPEPEQHECSCGAEIAEDDLAVCVGCGEDTCPDCMGDDGICKRCEAEG